MDPSPNDPPHVRMIKSSAKDYQNVYNAVERGQAVGAFTLADAKNIATACAYIETLFNESLGNRDIDIDANTMSSRWDIIVLALEKSCRKGAYGLSEAAAIHQSALKLTNTFKGLVAWCEKKAEDNKKVKFVKPPEDNIHVRES